MKKLLILISLTLLISLAYGCDANNPISSESTSTSGNTTTSDNTSEPTATQLKLQDYFPMKENTKYIFEGKGNEYAAYNIYIDYISEGRIQQRIDNGGTVVARVVELKDGKLTKIFSREEAYYRENFLKAVSNSEEILLMEPLAKGTNWTLKDSRVRTITNIDADVTTPTGSYKAIEVTTESKNDKTIDYYAKGVGLVKSIFTSGETEVTSSLGKIEDDVSLVQKINFYYPNVNDDKLLYESKDITFKTNDITKQVVEKAYKDVVTNSTGNVFTTNTKINSLYLNKDKMVYIDLNNAFLTEMNAGASYEKMILQSIANTFGQYYNSEKVILTIDNKPYESGHTVYKKGEYIKVDYTNAVEIKK